MQYVVKEIFDWQVVVEAVLEDIKQGVRIVLLDGNLGAGKTTFVQLMMKNLGSSDVVQSPTFSLINQYETDSHQAVYHMDLYRLKNQNELIEAGVLDAVDSGALCFIEWPALVEPFLGSNILRVQITLTETENRTVTLQRV